jgi:hypothetical protein
MPAPINPNFMLIPRNQSCHFATQTYCDGRRRHFRAPEPISQTPELRVLLDAMLADQLERCNLDLAAVFATEVADLAAAARF